MNWGGRRKRSLSSSLKTVRTSYVVHGPRRVSWAHEVFLSCWSSACSESVMNLKAASRGGDRASSGLDLRCWICCVRRKEHIRTICAFLCTFQWCVSVVISLESLALFITKHGRVSQQDEFVRVKLKWPATDFSSTPTKQVQECSRKFFSSW